MGDRCFSGALVETSLGLTVRVQVGYALEMAAPRTLFTILVLALLAAYAMGSIAGTLMNSVLEPLWKLLAGSMPTALVGGIDLGGFVSSVLAAILTLVLGILLLRLFLRIAWPMTERFLNLGSPGQKEQSDR